MEAQAATCARASDCRRLPLFAGVFDWRAPDAVNVVPYLCAAFSCRRRTPALSRRRAGRRASQSRTAASRAPALLLPKRCVATRGEVHVEPSSGAALRPAV